MLLYPDMTLLDLAGPQAALGMHGRTHLFWKTLDPVTTDGGIALLPTTAFADAPARLDVLFVPGGFGTAAAMRDEDIVAFLAGRGPGARHVTSVCSGSLLLGMAGLLDGCRAATPWRRSTSSRAASASWLTATASPAAGSRPASTSAWCCLPSCAAQRWRG